MLHSSLEIWLFLVQLVQLRKGNQNNTNFKKSNEIIYKQRYKYKRKWSQSVYPHAILWPCTLAKPTRSYERKVLSPFGNQLFSFLLAYIKRPLSSSKNPHFQNEAGYTTFLVKTSFICMRMKNDFHIKGWAPNLVLKQRLGGTRKWPIQLKFIRKLLYRSDA